MIVPRTCPLCGQDSSVRMSDDAYAAWKSGELIQDVLRDWPPAEREQAISGCHPQCFESLFPEDEE